ncbi:MAG: hypothetical protein ACK5HT_17305, partial [Draconibacterium sp.]
MFSKTLNNNLYFFDTNLKKIILISPILKDVIEEKLNGKPISPKLTSSNEDELNYYYRKYLFLKAKGYFAHPSKQDLKETFISP